MARNRPIAFSRITFGQTSTEPHKLADMRPGMCGIGFVLLAGNLCAAASLVMLTPDDAAKIKAGIEKKSPELRDFATALRKRADSAMKRGPWSVTSHRPAAFQLDAHDYYSEGPYFWPDPKRPGKSIRKDGERNPDRFDDNHRDMGAMAGAVLELGTAAYFFDDAKYAAKATEVIRVWFEDPATRMTPNLEHGQAVLGENDGRPTGIIDTNALIRCVQGMALLHASGNWPPEHEGRARKWFADYLNWLMETKKGIAEGNSGNNHMTWWTAQVASYAAFLGDGVAKKFTYAKFNNSLLKEFTETGAAPKEEARTNSISYSTFNLDAFSTLCRVAQVDGTDLWHAAPLVKALHYMAPFVTDPTTWKQQQIGEFKSGGLIFPGLAGTALKDAGLFKLHDSLKRGDDVWAGLMAAAVVVER